jgi:hypothetical protein
VQRYTRDMPPRLVFIAAAVLLAGALRAPAFAQQGAIWVAGGASSTGSSRIRAESAPPLLFGLEGSGLATQTVEVERSLGPLVEAGAQWFPARHVGFEVWLACERDEQWAPSSAYDTTLTYIARPPPDTLPRQVTYQQQTDWPPVRVALRRWTAGLNAVVGPVSSTRVAWTISGGLARVRVSGDVEPVGFTSFVLGGHSVLFPNEYLLNTRLEPAWGWRATAGSTLDLRLAGHLALTTGARVVFGDDLQPSLRVTGVDLSLAGFEPPPVEEISERLTSSSVNVSTRSLRVLAGLKVLF